MNALNWKIAGQSAILKVTIVFSLVDLAIFINLITIVCRCNIKVAEKVRLKLRCDFCFHNHFSLTLSSDPFKTCSSNAILSLRKEKL